MSPTLAPVLPEDLPSPRLDRAAIAEIVASGRRLLVQGGMGIHAPTASRARGRAPRRAARRRRYDLGGAEDPRDAPDRDPARAARREGRLRRREPHGGHQQGRLRDARPRVDRREGLVHRAGRRHLPRDRPLVPRGRRPVRRDRLLGPPRRDVREVGRGLHRRGGRRGRRPHRRHRPPAPGAHGGGARRDVAPVVAAGGVDATDVSRFLAAGRRACRWRRASSRAATATCTPRSRRCTSGRPPTTSRSSRAA